ncbi:GNAT family N-acetyltransferase [Streptomyces sp. NPDC057702]|uniref:GNAT family N-acetyltransferase n=1 Tax=unclassified Streptomyces TaxID=2593676 RepID=UPI0036C0A284
MKLSAYTSADAADIRETVLDMHDAVHRDPGDPFPSRERFGQFYDMWSAHPSWSCVVAFDGESAAGFAYGSTSGSGGWWKGSERPGSVPLGDSVFGLSELLVLGAWRRTGTSERLHDAVVRSRGDDVSTLLVDVSHPKVVALYERWGYAKVGEQKPFEDSPVFGVMVKRLAP